MAPNGEWFNSTCALRLVKLNILLKEETLRRLFFLCPRQLDLKNFLCYNEMGFTLRLAKPVNAAKSAINAPPRNLRRLHLAPFFKRKNQLFSHSNPLFRRSGPTRKSKIKKFFSKKLFASRYRKNGLRHATALSPIHSE